MKRKEEEKKEEVKKEVKKKIKKKELPTSVPRRSAQPTLMEEFQKNCYHSDL